MPLTLHTAGRSDAGVVGSQLDSPEANAARSVVCILVYPFMILTDTYSTSSGYFVNPEDQTTRYKACSFDNRIHKMLTFEQGEEVLHLPTIVEAAESSPAAAKECAQVIRKFLSKDGFSRPHVQYNGIMLVRILSDNPGPTFTRNLDKKFADTVKELLRLGRDPSVKQILIETLDNFQREKKSDENLAPLIQMWEKEQAKMEKTYGPKV